MTDKYMVIQAGTLTALQNEVNKHMETGWKCQGGLSCVQLPRKEGYVFDNYWFMQAMVFEVIKND